MNSYLLHVYKRGRRPFQSLSALPQQQALAIMSELYVEGSIFWKRFKDPLGYLSFRRQVEQNLRSGFLAKGGHPREPYPIYLFSALMELEKNPQYMEVTRSRRASNLRYPGLRPRGRSARAGPRPGTLRANRWRR